MKHPFRTGSLTVSRYMDVEIEVDVSDVIEFIQDSATDSDLSEIVNALNTINIGRFEFKSLDGDLVKLQKLELLNRAFSKYSLLELEERLDPTNSLI